MKKCKWVECLQGTDEWRKARLGKVTASKIDDVFKKGRTGESFGKVAEQYALELIAEDLTGKPADEIKAKPLEWGNKNEPGARATYALRSGAVCDEVGFATSLENIHLGCSADGLIGDEGTLEIKCPWNTTVHLKNLRAGEVPKEYMYQIQTQLLVMQLDFADFVSYDPRCPAKYRMMTKRVNRDEKMIEAIRERVDLFLGLKTTMRQMIDDGASENG